MAKVMLQFVGVKEIKSDDNLFLAILREVGGERQIPVLLGVTEAHMVTLAQCHMSPLSPLFFETFGNIFLHYNIQLLECYIYRFEHEIFSCFLILQQGKNTLSIEARFSDALALALYLDADIYIDEEELDKIQQRLRKRRRKLESLELNELNQMLHQAVENENYELASKIRDIINSRNTLFP